MTGLLMSMLLAAPAPSRDGAEILNEVRKLNVLGTVLYVAAHPDDENTRLLASFANEKKYRAAYLSFTRGEGGQNLIGAELGPLLGVIRTQELLAARSVDGAEQYFTRARDFGYSKSIDETLQTWDHDRVLADAVFIVRSLRPDLIITRFSLEAGGTHGHHTASARLALEAFKAAADPAFHPEQGLPPWQARRIVWNAWSPEGNVKLPPGTVFWDSSLYSPLLGRSYGELAALSRSMHKSQGFGAAPIHDGSVENFAPLDGEPAKTSLFDGIDATWARVPGAEKVSALLARAANEFQVDDPSKSLPVLLTALDELRKVPAHPWKEQKLGELTEVIAHSAGLFVEAASVTTSVVPGGVVTLKVVALNRSSAALKLDGVQVLGTSASPQAVLERGKAQQLELKVEVPNDTPLSSPFFLEQPPSPGTWTIAEGQPFEVPELPSPFTVEYRFSVGAQSFSLKRAAYFKWTDPTVGERYRPIEVLPAVVARPASELLLFTDAQPKTLDVTLTAQADDQRGEVKLDGATTEPASLPFALAKKGDEVTVRFKVKPPKSDGRLSVLVNGNATRSLTRVEYAHIPFQTVLAPAQVRVVRFELKRGRTQRVGYVPGAGDEVPAALRQVGYEVTLLSDAALRTERLAQFDAIVIGVRAYNVNARLPQVQTRLMDYVRDGGTLVAQYNTRNWLSSVPAQLGPWPFEISQDRVTDETAAVVREAHVIFKSPNALSDADFAGWVQERGLYFATKWDARYETPVSMNDPGEPPSKGSVLVARHGKGRFVYTGLSFFRQLPAGVPGAYRLFANLLDHGS
ncbi:MAG: PIG-L family deacetylase [Myxococcaceae bacterium]